MPAKRSLFVSLFSGCCPKCRIGKVFSHKVFAIMNFSSVKNNCANCGVKFETEPGFFWGAMYFSYALNVGISIVSGFVLYFLFGDPEYWIYISVMVPLILILTPPMVRFSRLLMMYMASPYRKYNPDLNSN